jgi:upstream activation factor subunit UAF30
MATAKRKKTKSKRKPNKAFMKPVTPSTVLAAIVGAKAIPRTEVTKRIWKYIRKQGLQDKTKRIMINADATLKKVLGGKSKVSMFELTKWVSKHLKG